MPYSLKVLALGSLVAILAVGSPVFAAKPGGVSGVALGAQIYARQCSLCHDNSEHMINDIGPALFGVVGRRVGSVDGFNYSPALLAGKGSGDLWTASRLDAFLTNPEHANPGTGMPVNYADPKNRAGIIAYLKTLKPKR
jgi:cytochrome c